MLKKTLVLLLLLYKVSSVYGAENIAGPSASLSNGYVSYDFNLKKNAILKVLSRYESPMIEDTDSFLKTCFKHELNCYLLPSISGLESTFGRFVQPGTYNPFGWGNGKITFGSWDEAIATVGSGLKNNYIDKGATSIEQIGSIYAASTTWASRINYFIAEFERAEQENKLEYSGLEIKL